MMPWLAFWVAMALSAILTPIGIAMAHRLGCVARPRADRWSTHFGGSRRPPALLGGVAIFVSLAVGAAIFLPWDRQMIGIAVGATFMFAVGLVDDIRGMRPHLKMAVQTAGA